MDNVRRYDLGMTECQHRYLDPSAAAPGIDSGVDEIRSFNFDAYPAFFNLSIAAGRHK